MFLLGIVKNVSFKQRETELLKYIEDKDFSYYVKSLIKEDMKRNGIIIKKKEKNNLPTYEEKSEQTKNITLSEAHREELERKTSIIMSENKISLREPIEKEEKSIKDNIKDKPKKRRIIDYDI